MKVLYEFPGTNAQGGFPQGGLTLGTDGYLYYGAVISTASGGAGLLYQITSAGHYTTLYTFNCCRGNNPYVSLFQNTNGILSGDTANGGTGSLCHCGVAYSLDMGLGPFVSVLPFASKVAKTVEFLGQGFTGTSNVSFNGAAATFKVVSDTYLTANGPERSNDEVRNCDHSRRHADKQQEIPRHS